MPWRLLGVGRMQTGERVWLPRAEQRNPQLQDILGTKGLPFLSIPQMVYFAFDL